MSYRLALLILTIALAATAPDMVAHAAPGDLDGTYATGGIYIGSPQTTNFGHAGHGLALDYLGRAVVAFRTDANHSREDIEIGVMRLTTDGKLDQSFNPTGPTPGILVTGFGDNSCADGTKNGPIFQAVAATPDHHIVVAANLCANTAPKAALMRLDDTGAFDSGFDGDGKLIFSTYASFAPALAVDSTERIYLAGGHCLSGGLNNCDSSDAFITRLTKEGTRDLSFNANGASPGLLEIVVPAHVSYFNAIKLLSGDAIVGGGTMVFGSDQVFLARISSTGELDTTFGASGALPGVVTTNLGAPNPNNFLPELYRLATTADEQSILVTGQVTNVSAGNATCPVAKFDAATGAPDTTWASGGTTPGVATAGSTCRDILAQPDDKIVTIGLNEQIEVTRFKADGTLDDGFGVGGIAKTALGIYVFVDSGALQTDGRILMAGIRGISNGDLNPVVARYLGDATPGPTPTGPTPTPTATPVDQPGEVCGNCIDDEPDGYTDRADPECGARANGSGQGLGDPKGAGKAIAKCGKAIQGAGAKLGAARLTQLQRCAQAVFACLQLKFADPKCLPKATATCAKQVAAATKDDAKLADGVAKACGVAGLALDDVKANVGLGFGAELTACADAGVGALGSLADLAACVRARETCIAERLLALQMPRASDLLAAGGVTPGSCLPAAGAVGTGLGDPAAAKAAVKCQNALVKAASKFSASERKAALACLQAGESCVQLKPGDPTCLTKLRATCAKQIGRLTGEGGGEAKLAAAVAKDCGGLPGADLTGADGLGFLARDTECSALGAPGAGSAAAIADCFRRQHECRVEEVLDATTPRASELFGLGQVTLP